LIRNSVITLFIISLFMSTAHAIGIGAGPSTIYFNNMLRGGYGEELIRVTNPNNFSIIVTIEAEGQVKDWLIFVPKISEKIVLTTGQLVIMSFKTFTVSPESSYEFRAIIQPPSDTPIGTYNGYINIHSEPVNITEGTGQLGTIVLTSAALRTFVNMTGEQILEYVIYGISIKDTEEGYPIEFSVSGENKGNVRAAPKVHIDIWNRDKTEIMKSENFTGSEVLPTREKSHEFSISSENLSVGQYWANITVYLGDGTIYQELLTFDLMAKGSMKIKGELIAIVNEVWVNVNEVVRIDAVFKNTGELPTYAKYKGEVYLGEELVSVLESEELMVAVGETVNLTTYFTPKKSGRYIARGVVFYEKKVTFTKDGIINVLPEESVLMSILSDKVFYILIIILLVIIVIKVLPRKGTDSLSGKYQKLDERIEKTVRDGRELQKRIRESKNRFKK